MLLPPLAKLNVAEFGYLGKLSQSSFLGFLAPNDIGRQSCPLHNDFICFTLLCLQYVFVSCFANLLVLRFVPELLRVFRRFIIRGIGRE